MPEQMTVNVSLKDIPQVRLLADAIPLLLDLRTKACRFLPADDPTLARIDSWMERALALAERQP